MRKLFSGIVSALFCTAVGIQAAEQVTISEFMAANTRGLRDENNQLEDWIEIRNSGTNAVNLDGWFLTDAIGNLTKWRFPATNIAAGGFIIVFADSADRKVPGAPLHANFNLSAGGEYLALVKPNLTIATEFRQVNNGYPGQAPDISYGFGALTSNSTVINTNTLVRWRIPDGSEGTNWVETNYNDSAWTVGTNGVGYGTTNTVQADYSQAVLPTAPVAYYRLNESSGGTATSIGSGSANGTYNNVTLGTAGPRPPAFNGFEPNNNGPTFNGTSSFVAGPSGFFSGRNAFTVGGWIRPTATPAARTGLFGQNDCVEFGFITGSTLECWTPSGGSVTAVPYPFPLNEWHHVVGVADGSTIRIFIDGVQAGQGGIATANYGSSSFNFNIGGGGVQDATGNFFPGQIDEVAAYHRALSSAEILALFQAGTNAVGGSAAQFVRTDVGPVMSNVNASAYIRIPFVVDNPTNVQGITLRMRYDDGFLAYINGTEVVRANATNSAFNATATNTHSPLAVEEYRFGGATLVAGTNILAIQGLNVSASDEDFLAGAELILTSGAAEGSVAVYFTTPTPGALNGAGIANPGPAIFQPGHSPLVPLDAQDLVVTARVAVAFFPVSSVVMRYRIMYSLPEIEVQMFDDGNHGDGGPGDGIFGATIPESASTNGQMIRWYFRATDLNGNVSRFPIFASAADTAEYLGTIVNPTNVTSKLPIIHLFAPAGILHPGPDASGNQPGADSQAGSQVSLFYDGEFYDNIRMELRGNSTAGFRKKSHRVEFNREHPFRYSNTAERIRKTSFVADYPDPTYMRQGLGYWLCDQMGAPAPFYEPVRLQLNGNFYQLANHNDVHGEELLERLGFDPNGALYNAAGQVTPGMASTGGFDKKTRTWENNADYTALANAIAESVPIGQRRTNVFDLFDVAEALNYIAAGRWIHENDDVWANLSLYHDNDGDTLWRIIPFDVNLSWGAIFAEGDASLYTGVQATNDTHKSHPLYGGAQILARSGPGGAYNRVYDAFFQSPQTREMFLRRLRTLLDTHIKPIGTPTNSTALEQMILARRDLIAEEALRDRAWWNWPGVGGQNNFAQGIDITNGVNQMLDQFLRTRRIHFYGKHSITNTALPLFNGSGTFQSNTVAGIPAAQATNLFLRISQIEFNPSSANQGHEFITISNPNPVAVDMSGWRLDGGVDFTFRPGTVIPSFGLLFVTPDRNAFRTRTTSPRTNQALFVVGNYQGTLDARGEIVRLLDDTERLVHTNGYTPNPSLAQQYLRITELMYHPGPTNVGSPYGQEEFEYLELKNIGPTNLNLVGIHFTNGIEFAFRTTSLVTNLAPGQVVVLVKNTNAFALRYGGAATIAGVYSNSLDNGGERIKLDDALGEQILDFDYNNTWYPVTDGLGFSLVIVDENAPWNTWDEKESWRPSGNLNGSAGTNDPGPVTDYGVLVNEVLANTDSPDVDAIELWNASTNTVDIGGWWISDDVLTPKKFQVPPNTMLAPGAFALFTEADFNPGGAGFSFSSAGDEAYLFAADGLGNLTGYSHGFGYDASEPGVSFGRYVTSDGDEHFVAQSSVTLSNANAAPKVGPIVISEVMYHPPDVGGQDDTASEFIELHNITTNDVPLFDVAYPTNRWRLRDAVDFDFSTNTIPAGGYLLVVSFDPETNAVALGNFRAKYGLDTNVVIVGPFSGQLDNSEDDIELRKPDTSVLTNVTSVLVEKVHYHDDTPWNPVADGLGAALQRLVLTDFGNDATNWAAAVPTPGSGFPGGAGPEITGHPSGGTAFVGGTVSLTAVVSGSGVLVQWRRDGTVLSGATNATLTLSNLTLANAGSYSLSAFNGAGSAVSSNADVIVLTPVTIATHPAGTNVQPATNVTLSVAAIGNGTVRYQWQFEGVDIPNATNSTYSFTNANLNQHHGNYRVIVRDDFSTSDPASFAVSSNAFVYVMVRPAFLIHPAPQVVIQGGTAVFTAVATGAPPIYYRWVRQGAAFLTNTTGILILTNVQPPPFAPSIRAAATNLASGPSGQNSAIVTLTIQPDADGDGIGDAWETNYGFNTNLTADGALDFDGDGMSNHDEYIAGTNPTNALSVLKLSLTSTNQAVLQFVAQSNISYIVQCRTNLTTAPWQAVTNIYGETNSVRTILLNVSNPPPVDLERYYRVVTPMSSP